MKFNIEKRQVLSILNYNSDQVDPDLDQAIGEGIQIIETISRPRSTYLILDKDDPRLGKLLLGQDINDLLENCYQVILMAMTLGQEVEMAIRRASYRDMSMALVLDAVASGAIESLAEDLNQDLAREFEPLYLSDRFSPGYGDLPISVQKDFLDLVGARSKLGLTTNEEGIMIPRKSITALIGISHLAQVHRHRGCESCRLYDNCQKRLNDEVCSYGR